MVDKSIKCLIKVLPDGITLAANEIYQLETKVLVLYNFCGLSRILTIAVILPVFQMAD